MVRHRLFPSGMLPSVTWLDDAWRDLRHAARTLRRSPAYSATAVATLALAIALSTTMFSVLEAVLLRPLPFQAPERLAMLWTDDATRNVREGRSALWDVEQWRDHSRSFADLATFDLVSTTLTGPDGAEQIAAASISPNLLPMLGVQPVLGRGFSIDEARQDQRLVLISDAFWRTRFGGSHGVTGATLVLDGVPALVIGVLPADFRIGTFDADVWMPHTSRGNVRGPQTWFAIGRLRPGARFDQAEAELNAIVRRLDERLPEAERTRGISIVPLSVQLVGPQSRLALWILAGAVFCVFLIAVSNVTSLSMARGVARGREMAVRAALGASAGRILRQLLAEGLVLATVSGLIGTALAWAGIRAVRAVGPADLPRLGDAGLDLRVLGCALAVSAIAGILVSLAPASVAFRGDVGPAREEGGRSLSGGAVARRARRALVVAEFAVAIVLLVGAGLLVRSWWHVNRVDPGFRPPRVLVMNLSAPTTFSLPAQRADLYDRVLARIQAVPGVERAGIVDDLFSANPRERVVTVERDEGTIVERLRLTTDEVSTGFFEAIGARLLGGRLFSARDRADAPPVAIVNEAMARRAWPGQDPTGRRFRLGPPTAEGAWHTVVGVVADMRRQGLEREAIPQVFVPLAQNAPSRTVNLLVQTSSDDPLAMVAAVRGAVRHVEKDARIDRVSTLEQALGGYLAQRRFQTSLLTAFSVVALLMAAVGIYGLIQYSISMRTQEIGVRLALGAQSGDIFRMVIGEGLTLSLIGLAIGLVAAWWVAAAGSSLLFGVTAGDPATFTSVPLLLTAVAALACYFPARRAMRIDPIVTLRVS